MNSVKRNVSLLLMLVILVVASLSMISACGDDDTTDPTPAPSTPTAEYVTLSFETNGGTAIQPMQVVKGTLLAANKLPTTSKEGQSFVDWYTNDTMETVFDVDTYIFNANTTLYAAFRVDIDIPETSVNENFYAQESTSLLDQPTDVSLLICGEGELTETSLSSVLTVTAQSVNVIPPVIPEFALAQTAGGYLLSPKTRWEAGADYQLTLTAPWKFSVTTTGASLIEMEESKLEVKTVDLSISKANASSIAYSTAAIAVNPSDYYYIADNYIYLKKDFALSDEVALARDAILRVNADDESFEYYKVGNISTKYIGAEETVCVELLAAKLTEVYTDASFHETGVISDDDVTYSIQEAEAINEIKNSEGLRRYIGLATAAIGDYARQHNMDVSGLSAAEPMVAMTQDKTKSTIKEYELSTNVTIKINNKASATVKIKVKQSVGVGYGTKGKIKWFDDYNIDIYTLISSNTVLKIDVILKNDGKTTNIREDIDKLVKNPDTSGMVSDYVRNFNLDTDEITLFSLKLFQASVKVKIVEFTFPVKLNVRMTPNAAFAADYENFVSYKVGVKGTDKKGLSAYKTELLKETDYAFSYNGKLFLEAGLEFDLEISFVGLNELGCVGLGVEIGCYFEYYGIGYSDEYKMAYGAYYYEFGVYLDLKLYAESKLFDLRAEAKVFSLRKPIRDGGKMEVAVGFANDDVVVTLHNKETFGISNSDMIKLSVLNLKTGKITEKDADLKKLVVYDQYYVFEKFDSKSGEVTLDLGKHNRTRYDDELYIAYFGDRLAFKGYASPNHVYQYYLCPPLIQTAKIVWLNEGVEIDEEDLFKTVTVTYKINGNVIYDEEVLYGGWGTFNGLTFPLGFEVNEDPDDDFRDETGKFDRGSFFAHRFNKKGFDMIAFVKNNMHLDSFGFSGSYDPLFADVEYEAYFKYKEYAMVDFVYYYKTERNFYGEDVLPTKTATVYAGVGGTFDCETYYIDTDQIEGFSAELPNGPDFNQYVTFKNWDLSAFGEDGIVPKPEQGERIVVNAVYEYTPFEYNVVIPALYDDLNQLLLGEQRYSLTTTLGTIPEMEFQLHPLYDIKFAEVLSDESVLYLDRPLIANGPRTVTAEWRKVNYYTVSVLNHRSEVIEVKENIRYGEDATDVLAETSVTEFLAEYSDYSIGTAGLSYRFIGWAQEEYLSAVTADLYIFPIYEQYYKTTLLKVNGNGGKIPTHMQYTATNGMEVVEGDEWTTDDEFLKNFEPTSRTYYGVMQEFTGWAIDKTQAGVWTYVAQYAEVEYSLTIYADGTIITFEGGAASSSPVDASFAGGKESVTITGTYEYINDYANSINDEQSTVPEPILPAESGYEFYRWQILVIDNTWEAIPEYKTAAGIATIRFDIGKGTYDGKTGVLIETMQLGAGNTVTIFLSNCLEPVMQAYDECAWFDVATTSYVHPNCAYYDDAYYYTLGHWVDADNNVLPNSSTFTLSAGDLLELKYVYTQNERSFLAKFCANIVAREFLDDNKVYGTVMFNGTYGEEPAQEDIPVATKEAEELSLYYYVFKHWAVYTDDNNSVPTGEIGLDNIFKADYLYRPVFERKLREITVTFDAGENGIFPSTGTRYRTSILGAGSILYDYGEIPTYTSSSKYYNEVFDSWSYYPGITLSSNSTISARFKKISNAESTDEPVGITITKYGRSEDIGVRHLKCYEYDPDLRILHIKEAGTTITSNNNTVTDIDIIVYSENVTLKNLSLSSTNAIEIANENVVVYVDGTVNLSVSQTALSDAISASILIKGKSNNATLNVSDNSQMASGSENVIIFEGKDITIEDLDVNVVISAVIAQPIIVFDSVSSEVGKLTIKNSNVAINIVEDNGKTNYAVYMQSGDGADFYKDTASTFTCEGYCTEHNWS